MGLTIKCPNCGRALTVPSVSPTPVHYHSHLKSNKSSNIARVIIASILVVFIIIILGSFANHTEKNYSRATTRQLDDGARTRNLPPTTLVESQYTKGQSNLFKMVPRLDWSRQTFVDEGWMKPGQTLTKMFNRDLQMYGVDGNLCYIFQEADMTSVLFTLKNKSDLPKLYGSTSAWLGSKGFEYDDYKLHEFRWFVQGADRGYKINVFDEKGAYGDYGLEIEISDPKK